MRPSTEGRFEPFLFAKYPYVRVFQKLVFQGVHLDGMMNGIGPVLIRSGFRLLAIY